MPAVYQRRDPLAQWESWLTKQVVRDDDSVRERSTKTRVTPPRKKERKYAGRSSLLLARISGLLKRCRKKCWSHANQREQVDVSRGAARKATMGSKNDLDAMAKRRRECELVMETKLKKRVARDFKVDRTMPPFLVIKSPVINAARVASRDKLADKEVLVGYIAKSYTTGEQFDAGNCIVCVISGLIVTVELMHRCVEVALLVEPCFLYEFLFLH